MVAPLEAGDEIFTLTKLFNRLDSKSIPNHLLPSIWETLQQQFDNHTALVAYLRAYTTIDLPKGSGSSVSSVQKIVNEKVQHVYAGKSSFIKRKIFDPPVPTPNLTPKPTFVLPPSNPLPSIYSPSARTGSKSELLEESSDSEDAEGLGESWSASIGAYKTRSPTAAVDNSPKTKEELLSTLLKAFSLNFQDPTRWSLSPEAANHQAQIVIKYFEKFSFDSLKIINNARNSTSPIEDLVRAGVGKGLKEKNLTHLIYGKYFKVKKEDLKKLCDSRNNTTKSRAPPMVAAAEALASRTSNTLSESSPTSLDIILNYIGMTAKTFSTRDTGASREIINSRLPGAKPPRLIVEVINIKEDRELKEAGGKQKEIDHYTSVILMDPSMNGKVEGEDLDEAIGALEESFIFLVNTPFITNIVPGGQYINFPPLDSIFPKEILEVLTQLKKDLKLDSTAPSSTFSVVLLLSSPGVQNGTVFDGKLATFFKAAILAIIGANAFITTSSTSPRPSSAVGPRFIFCDQHNRAKIAGEEYTYGVEESIQHLEAKLLGGDLIKVILPTCSATGFIFHHMMSRGQKVNEVSASTKRVIASRGSVFHPVPGEEEVWIVVRNSALISLRNGLQDLVTTSASYIAYSLLDLLKLAHSITTIEHDYYPSTLFDKAINSTRPPGLDQIGKEKFRRIQKIWANYSRFLIDYYAQPSLLTELARAALVDLENSWTIKDVQDTSDPFFNNPTITTKALMLNLKKRNITADLLTIIVLVKARYSGLISLLSFVDARSKAPTARPITAGAPFQMPLWPEGKLDSEGAYVGQLSIRGPIVIVQEVNNAITARELLVASASNYGLKNIKVLIPEGMTPAQLKLDYLELVLDQNPLLGGTPSLRLSNSSDPANSKAAIDSRFPRSSNSTRITASGWLKRGISGARGKENEVKKGMLLRQVLTFDFQLDAWKLLDPGAVQVHVDSCALFQSIENKRAFTLWEYHVIYHQKLFGNDRKYDWVVLLTGGGSNVSVSRERYYINKLDTESTKKNNKNRVLSFIYFSARVPFPKGTYISNGEEREGKKRNRTDYRTFPGKKMKKS